MGRKHKSIWTVWSCGLMLFCFSLEAIACESGWFGSKCLYRCRCTSDQCNSDGQCTPGYKCKRGWFGPGCQYVDLASRERSNYERITDGDETTCVTTRLQSVTLTLDDSYHFTWLRVHLRQPDFLHDLTVTFNSRLSCTNPRNSNVDDTTLDIYCDLNQRVQTVTLTGTAVRYLCSVYVSGGRNVALKQSTSQSSTYWELTSLTGNKGISFTSDKAVDGDTSGEFYKNGYPCSHTRDSDTGNNWAVRFSKPQRVTRYVLYNRADAHGDRLKRFVLESFGEDGNQLFNYLDRALTGQDIYKIPSRSVTSPVSRVMIKNALTYLTICELEIYGDSVCVSGYYGRECEHKCNCARNEACFVSTGGCPSGCADGFQGRSCNETCDAGKYGEKCNFNCSQFCQLSPTGSQHSSCDHVDGICRHGCQTGYEGEYCLSACDAGKYGEKCSFNCSQFCQLSPNGSQDSSCDHVDGTCRHGCQTGYEGEYCLTACDAGKYGEKCSFNCSQFCQLSPNGSQDSSCDHVDGTCRHGCQTGYEGEYCLTAHSESDELTATGVGVLLAVIFVAVLTGLGFIFLRRHKRAQPGKLQEHPSKSFTGNKSLNRINVSLLEVSVNTPPVTRYEHPHPQEDGYEEISRIISHPHNVGDGSNKHDKAREVPPDSDKMQQDLGAFSYDETDRHIYEEIHDDDEDNGRRTDAIYNNI